MRYAKSFTILGILMLGTLLVLWQSALAGPPQKPGNPGLPGCLSEVAAKEATIAALQDEIANLNNLVNQLQSQALLPQTGQITSYATGDDGNLRKGVPWPNPRFTDNGDGTVTDNLTGLIWLQNANCFGIRTWFDALSDCNNLEDGNCGLSDASSKGDWRLPNRNELESLMDFEVVSLPLVPPFINGGWKYWSSTAYGSTQAWFMEANGVVDATPPVVLWSVWPVRDAKK